MGLQGGQGLAGLAGAQTGQLGQLGGEMVVGILQDVGYVIFAKEKFIR